MAPRVSRSTSSRWPHRVDRSGLHPARACHTPPAPCLCTTFTKSMCHLYSYLSIFNFFQKNRTGSHSPEREKLAFLAPNGRKVEHMIQCQLILLPWSSTQGPLPLAEQKAQGHGDSPEFPGSERSHSQHGRPRGWCWTLCPSHGRGASQAHLWDDQEAGCAYSPGTVLSLASAKRCPRARRPLCTSLYSVTTSHGTSLNVFSCDTQHPSLPSDKPRSQSSHPLPQLCSLDQSLNSLHRSFFS